MLVELKCGTKIGWMEPCSFAIKKGIIVNERHVRSNSYDVAELDTGLFYNVHQIDITLVFVDGEWIEYKRSGRYPWTDDMTYREMRKRNKKNCFEPKKVVFNGPATVVLWKDGTKTIVKRREGEPDDKEKAVMYCILKKLCGNKATMDKYLKLFLKEEESNEEKKEEAGSSKSDWKKPRAGSGCSEGDL